MTVMGEKIDLFNVPVCNMFTPKILEGQLCYEVNVNEVKDKVDAKEAIKHGLIFILDYNQDKMITDNNAEVNDPLENDLHPQHKLILRKVDETLAAKIYIETIGRKFQ